jgi:hypothetical protein
MNNRPDPERQAQLMAEIRRDVAVRQKGYRERALKIFPPLCARCSREFAGVRMKELTVHHRDHNHDNNPPDGSNWELLCIYCHDHEHEKYRMKGHGSGTSSVETRNLPPLANPFDSLDALIKPKDAT